MNNHVINGCQYSGICTSAGCENHLEFKTWLEDVINSNSVYGYSELILSGFLRFVTHPKIFKEPSSLKMALSFVNQFRLQANAPYVAPGKTTLGYFSEFT